MMLPKTVIFQIYYRHCHKCEQYKIYFCELSVTSLLDQPIGMCASPHKGFSPDLTAVERKYSGCALLLK